MAQVTPMPAYLMAASVARLYGANHAIVILDFDDGVRIGYSRDISTDDGLFMLGCATSSVINREPALAPPPQEKTDP